MVNSKLDDVFGSLSDPTRRDMLQRLLKGELSVNQLAQAYNMSLPAVSKHLKVLEMAGLITKERRGRQQFVRLAVNNFQSAADHLLHYQTDLNNRLQSLDTYLQNGSVPAKKKATTKKKPSLQTLVITHTFDAPRQEVWDTYIDPKHIAQWWAPVGVEILSCYNDVRVGGVLRFAFRGVDGQNGVMGGKYREVDAPKRLVYTDGFGEADSDRPEAVTTVTFEELPDGRTKLTKSSVAPRSTHQLHAAWLRAAEGLLD